MICNLIELVKNKYKRADNKDLANNTVALTILNVFNFILPVVTIPILLNSLGAVAYGIVNIYISLYAIFQKIVNYGFDYIGTRNIAISNDKQTQCLTYSVILSCKLINALLIIAFSACYFIFFDSVHALVALIISSELIGTALNMNWLYQGLKKMKIITMITSIVKIIYSVLIIVLIQNSEDIYLYAILYSFTSIGIGAAGFFVAQSGHFGIRIVKIKISSLLDAYKEGWHMFVASLCSGLSTNLCTVVLGALKGEAYVAYFSSGYKIVQAISLVFSAITQALYPFSCEKFKISFMVGRDYVFKVMKPVLLIIGLACLAISIGSKFIFEFIYEPEYWSYYPIAIMGSIWIFFGFLGNFLGIQILVASDNSSSYRSLFTYATIITILLYYLLIPYLDAYGSMLALLLGEILLSMMLYYRINKIIKQHIA